MAYLVLARKYRPERFSELVGQEHITRTLINAIEHDRLHHAYLFCGIRGLGKTTAARILARCLTCEQAPTTEPCGTCRQCVGIRDGQAVDVVEIDGASNNSVDDVRHLREQVHHLPLVAKRKVYIIDEVHMMSTSAFNALLKTLEEPPPHVTFIFATTDPHKVIETILSRVSRFDFRRVDPARMVTHLAQVLSKEQMHVDEEGLRMVARVSDGSVRDALTYLDKIISFAEDPAHVSAEEVRLILGQVDRFAVFELADAVLAAEPHETLARFDAIASTASNLLHVATAFLQHLRDLAVVQVVPDDSTAASPLLNASEGTLERLRAQAMERSPTHIAQLFDRFTTVVERAATSSSPRLVIEMGLLDLVHATPMQPLGALVERLHALEGQANGGRRLAPSSAAPTRASSPRRDRPSAQRHASANPIAGARPGPDTGNPSPNSARGPQPDAPGTRGQPTTASPTPTPSTSTPAATTPAATTPAADPDNPYWAILGMNPGDSAPPGRAEPSPVSQRPPTGAATTGKEPATRARETPQRPDADPRFRLDPAPPPGTPPPQGGRMREDAGAGCPSSRCTPKAAIPWREMEPLPVWETLLRVVEEEDAFAFAVLADMGLLGLTEQRLTLACARNSFGWQEFSRGPEIEATLRRVILERLGEPLEVQFEDQSPSVPDAPSLTMLRRARADAHVQQTETLAREHAAVRALVDTFDAEISRVATLSEPPT